MQMIVTICLFLVSPKRWVWFCTVGEEGPWSTLSLPWIRQWLRPRIQDEEILGKTTYLIECSFMNRMLFTDLY